MKHFTDLFNKKCNTKNNKETYKSSTKKEITKCN